MESVLSLLLIFCLQTSTVPSAHVGDGRHALPDTTTIRAEVAAFMELSPETRTQQAAFAANVFEEWLPRFKVKDGEVKVGLPGALSWQCYQRGRMKYGVQVVVKQNILGEAVAAFEDGVMADPTNLPLRVMLGFVMVKTGRPREGIDQLEKALLIAEYGWAGDPDLDADDANALIDYLRNTSYVVLAFGYRDLGRWEQAEQAADKALAMRRSPIARLIKGLCLAGSGETSKAIHWAVKMPPLKFRRVSGLSGGYEPHASAYANEWIKSQALFTIGDLDGANYVLGELDRRFFQRMPLSRRFWEDAGLVAEMRGDPQAGWIYAFAGAGAYMGYFYPSEDATTEPLILGFPSREVPYFITPDGGFEGGSPFGYLCEQLSIISDQRDEHAAERARVRALDLCDGLLARGVQPDLVTAFRARVYLAAGQAKFAYPDLVYAQAGFASRQLVDPGTSLLLGQQELLAGNNERSVELFREALTEIPDDALVWRELGIALGRVGQPELAHQAMEKALELAPNSMEGWYNLGLLDFRNGAHDEALRSLEKAWALEPGNEQVQQVLQVVNTARRRQVQAR